MGHVDYNGPSLVFSGNAGELTYAVSESESLYVRNGLTGATKFPIRCIKDGKERTVRISDVLEFLPMNMAVLPESFGNDDNCVASLFVPNDIVFDIDGDEVELKAIPGRISDGSELSSSQMNTILQRLATVGPLTRHTTIESQDYLSFFIPWAMSVSPAEDRIQLSIAFYTGADDPLVSSLNFGYPATDELFKGSVLVIPLNQKRIHDRFYDYPLRGSQQLLQYRLSVSLNRNTSIRSNVTFIVHNGSAVVTDFAFLNDLGGIDSIHAFGGRTDVPSFTTQTFMNDRTEKVLRIDEEQVVEVQSGPIQSGAERSFWMSFLRSAKKWWIRDGLFGREAVSIIVEDSSPEMANGKIGEIKFRFRTVKKEGIGKLEDLTF